MGPAIASRTAAVSLTVRVRTGSITLPRRPPLRAGPVDSRPRDGFNPTRPQQAAGPRIDPVASLPCATATMPEATAAAEPPLEPPGVRLTSQGLRVGPNASGSVTGPLASSGRFVFPMKMNPAARSLLARELSPFDRQSKSPPNFVPS